VGEIVSAIAAASSEQSAGIDEVNAAISRMDEVTQQNSAVVEQNAAAARALEQQAQGMTERVSFFRLGDKSAESITEGTRHSTEALLMTTSAGPMPRSAPRIAPSVARRAVA
jgi:hypothetical protein